MMNKEMLAKTASEQRSTLWHYELRSGDPIIEELGAESRAFYKEHHADLFELAHEEMEYDTARREMEADGIPFCEEYPDIIRRNRIASQAASNYSTLRRRYNAVEAADNWYLKPDPYRTARQAESAKQSHRNYSEFQLHQLWHAVDEAKQLYKDHYADLHDMAREEMEADGIAFVSEDDTYKVTAYHYGEEIADIEEESPLNGLGAKIVFIAQRHIDSSNREAGRTPSSLVGY